MDDESKRDIPEDLLEAALKAEVASLRRAGFSKAYICERSIEIEERERWRLIADDCRRKTGV